MIKNSGSAEQIRDADDGQAIRSLLGEFLRQDITVDGAAAAAF